MAIDDGQRADVRGGDIAAGVGELSGFGRGWVCGAGHEVVGVVVGMREQPANHVGVVAGVVGLLGDRPLAEIVIAGEAGGAGAMLG